jgi:RHS repeat-associated protein
MSITRHLRRSFGTADGCIQNAPQRSACGTRSNDAQYLNYDIENRISGVGTYSGDTSVAQYGYDAGNKRVWRGGGTTDELTFWAPNGQKLGTYSVKYDSVYYSGYYLQLSQTWVYFGGKMVSKGVLNLSNSNSTQDKVDLSSVIQDRLGSQNGKFYPYGIERPSASANDTEKFATYTRDSATGLDYADQRYHQPGAGRFLSPDPYAGSAHQGDPGTWNRYAYVGGDPVNESDPTGLDAFFQYVTFTVSGLDPGSSGSSSWDCAFLGICNGPIWTEPYTDLGISNQTILGPRNNNNGMASTADARSLLKDALAGSFSNCEKVLSQYAGHARLMSIVDVKMRFLDGRGDGNMGMAGDSRYSAISFAQYHQRYPSTAASTLTTSSHGFNRVSTTVVLWHDFFADTVSGQEVTLIHELMHMITNTDTHAAIARSFGIKVEDEVKASAAIDKWIENKCN